MSHPLDSLRRSIRENVLANEADAVARLIASSDLSPADRAAISSRGAGLVEEVRRSATPQLIEIVLREFGLSTREGIALMCLAEALLRVPDAQTIDELIRDKIAPHDWLARSGANSIFVNASTWALMLTGSVLDEGDAGIAGTLRAMVRRLGEPIIRTAVASAMRAMGDQFVLGHTMARALERARAATRQGYLYSFDMLGEAARTEADARRYHRAYADAIAALAAGAAAPDVAANNGISVKLSALHPRYEAAQHDRAVPAVAEQLFTLAEAARTARIGLNIDAEEADRLDLSLDVIEAVARRPELAGWNGLGIVVQAYGPRAALVIDWLHALAETLDRRFMVRLVKGAYWDTEIKRAQVLGLAGYPVFTRKAHTDISYIACARKLLGMGERIYPQFATHNAHSAAAILEIAHRNGRDRTSFEFQRLHGMGEALHETLRTREGTRCRIYAPVGEHADLLAYLVRRLLENGANSSFVHQITDRAISARTIAQDPFASGYVPGPLPLPEALFAPERRNARGTDITDPLALAALDAARAPFASPHRWQAGESGPARPVRNPARPAEVVGEVREADATLVAEAVGAAAAAFPDWSGRPAAERAGSLEKAADLYERHAAELLALCAREAGKTLPDAIAEIREAVDFLRYYAARASAAPLPGAARGVIACISPWNFPLAIFTGQVAAALVAGNTVVAKPAEQTPLIAARAVALLHEAGVPESALCLVCGDGPTTGAPLAADPRIAGICFTGSTAVAKRLELQLATSACGPDPMLIAETGGINAMIVDSTALPEQAVRDIVASAFQSAGQRCSALRILYLQREVEEKILTMLQGAMEELRLGDPWAVATDIGPVIDPEARQDLLAYCDRMEKAGRLVARREAPADGLFVPPHIFRVRGIAELEREVFGPVLHVASFAASELDTVIAGINAKGYGLTFGLHTRIDARVEAVVEAVHAGNIYVNRNQIGAVVGSQPFGGEGLSGTGPKAGGPNYLRRFRTTGVAFAATKAGGRASPAAAPLAFPDAAGWARRPDRVAALRKLLRGKAGQAIAAAATLDYGPVDLPGPTGEANTLVLAPRGTALCLGPDMDMLLAQVIQALAAGNSVLAVAPDATAGLKPLAGADLPLSVIDTTITPEQAADLDADVVAYGADDETLRAIRQALAGGAGPITRLVAEAIDAVSFCHERVVCVDTTAAGGNATLLATTGEGAP